MRRVMFLHKEKLYIVDMPSSDMANIVIDECKKNKAPFLYFSWNKESKQWFEMPQSLYSKQVRDAIGRVPFEYEDKFIRRDYDDEGIHQ